MTSMKVVFEFKNGSLIARELTKETNSTIWYINGKGREISKRRTQKGNVWVSFDICKKDLSDRIEKKIELLELEIKEKKQVLENIRQMKKPSL
jgi:16S rRNA C1402 (ribose-2'-O) methylase RsmI